MSEEKTFSKLFISHLPKLAHHQRIETGLTGRGIPDINICFEAEECWVELKVVKGKQVQLAPEQVAWHYRRHRAGGTTWIVARDKYDGVRKGKGDDIYIWKGLDAPEVLKHGIEFPSLYKFSSPFDWDLIMKCLFKRGKGYAP